MNKFKVGDKVYFPIRSHRVLTVEGYYGDEAYPILVGGYTFTREGKYRMSDGLPAIFHATPENHKLLESLYGAEFETPSVKPSSQDIVLAMLAKGHRYVPCRVSNELKKPNEGFYALDFIVGVTSDGRFYNHLGRSWKHAVPIDKDTGEIMEELPE